MKNLFFALLACLLTACFRAPQLTPLPPHHSTPLPTQAAAPLPSGPEVYASASDAAAAGTAPSGAGEVVATPALTPTYALANAERVDASKARNTPRPTNLRLELRKAVRATLLPKRPAAGTQDNPAPRESALPTIALVAGIVGIVGLVGSFAAGVIGAGPIGAGLFVLGFLGGLLAVILGGIAKGRIRRGLEAGSGRGKATAGLILGIVDLSIIFLLFILGLLIVIALSNTR